MKAAARCFCVISLSYSLVPFASGAEEPKSVEWSQFRGPNGSGVAEGAHPPTVLDRKRNLVWSTETPAGHSSPSVAADRLFLTAWDSGTKKLEVLALNLKDGKVLWRRPVPFTELEKVHEVGSPATATPALSGDSVYVYFGSFGLVAYDFNGVEKWKLPLPLPKMSFGSGTSPVVAGDRILLNRDESRDPFLLAVRASDGKEVWRKSYASAGPFGAYATPVLFKDAAVIHRSGEVAAFRIEDGSQIWQVATGSGASVPVLGDGRIYLTSWSPFGEQDHLPPLPTFEELLKSDADKDGKLSKEEFPSEVFLFRRPDIDVTGSAVRIRDFFGRMDQNKNGFVEQEEWGQTQKMLGTMRQSSTHGLSAIEPGGAVLWKEARSVPEISSPVYYRGRVYMVTNGGIATCVNAADGKVLYRGRLGAPGAYFASPVAANGHLYFASSEGIVTVVKDNAESLQVVSQTSLDDGIYASPAIVGSRIYIRTVHRMWAFGE